MRWVSDASLDSSVFRLFQLPADTVPRTDLSTALCWTVTSRSTKNRNKHSDSDKYNLTVLRECTPPPRTVSQPKVSNQDSDPDVCRITPKMLWIHYLVTVSHFAECRENQPLTAREMLIISYSAMVSEVEKWSRIHIWNQITTKS